MNVRRFLTASIIASALALAVPTFAQKPANAPNNATAQCTDGTFSTAKTERGACSKHGGVKTWWGEGAAAKAAPAAAPAGSTAQCKDGTYTSAKSKQGACSGHGGIGTWLADRAPAPKAAPPPAPAAPSAPTPTAAPKTPTKSAANAPENATAKCKDGTFSYSKQHSGACSHHGGVAEWYK